MFSKTHEKVGSEYLRSREKRIADVIVASALRGMGLPAEVLCKNLLPLETGGNKVFQQERFMVPGPGDQRHIGAVSFLMEKLQTLKGDVDEGLSQYGPQHNRAGRLGSFVRAARIDELPQTKAVLQGSMSIIGPRAITWEDMCEYLAAIDQLYVTEATKDNIRNDWFRARRVAKPGLAAMWSVDQYREGYELDRFKVIESDIKYAETASLKLDRRIVQGLFTGLGGAATRSMTRRVSGLWTPEWVVDAEPATEFTSVLSDSTHMKSAA